jgi:hypothetical protein
MALRPCAWKRWYRGIPKPLAIPAPVPAGEFLPQTVTRVRGYRPDRAAPHPDAMHAVDPDMLGAVGLKHAREQLRQLADVARYTPRLAREQLVCRTPLIMVPRMLDGRCPVSVSRLRQTL